MSKKILGYMLLMIFVAYLVMYIHSHGSDFKALLQISPVTIVLIAVCHLLSIFLNGLFVKLSIQPFRKYISRPESFFVALITTLGNYLMPVGVGTGIKAVYLKKKIQLSYTDFLATLSGNYIIVFLFNSGLGLIALLTLRHLAPASLSASIIVVLLVIFISMLTLAFYGFPKKIINALLKTTYLKTATQHLSNVLRGWNIITTSKSLLMQLIGLTALNFFLAAVVAEIAAKSLGFTFGFWQLMLYTSLGSLSILLNITPGSIGIRETIFIVYSSLIGLNVAEILSISIIVNGTLFIVLVISWLILQVPSIKHKIKLEIKED